MARKAIFLGLFFLALYSTTGAQSSFAAQEKKLAHLYERLYSFAQHDWDSTGLYAGRFGDALRAFVRKEPGTLHYPFRLLTDSSYCTIATSPDEAFRIYSWDTWTGGSMHVFQSFFQWRSAGNVYTKAPDYPEGDAGVFYSRIYQVRNGSKQYYLAISNAIFSNKDVQQSVQVYSLNGAQLLDTARLFRTRKERLSRIDVDFDFFSVVDRPERPVEVIRYDEKRQCLYVAVVGKKDAVTPFNIVYRWTNGQFVYTGIEPAKPK